MKIKGQNISLKTAFALILYYSLARYLPRSTNHIFGKPSKNFRYILVKRIFKSCGTDVNVERGAFFGWGVDVEIGDHSGIGLNAVVPNNVIIGNYVMMGPNCYMISQNHAFDRLDMPMMLQGYTTSYNRIIIEDDVWIGRNVTMTPGRHIQKGSIIGAQCMLTKDFPEYSVIGGNPSRLLKSRR